MYAKAGNNCGFVLETHGGQMQATTKEQPSTHHYYTDYSDRQGTVDYTLCPATNSMAPEVVMAYIQFLYDKITENEKQAATEFLILMWYTACNTYEKNELRFLKLH
jgi:hypothetical protein